MNRWVCTCGEPPLLYKLWLCICGDDCGDDWAGGEGTMAICWKLPLELTRMIPCAAVCGGRGACPGLSLSPPPLPERARANIGGLSGETCDAPDEDPAVVSALVVWDNAKGTALSVTEELAGEGGEAGESAAAVFKCAGAPRLSNCGPPPCNIPFAEWSRPGSDMRRCASSNGVNCVEPLLKLDGALTPVSAGASKELGGGLR